MDSATKPINFQEALRKEIFLFTRKQGGYINVLNCFPNSYEVGMASLGYQLVFKLFSEHEKTSTYRYFTNFYEKFPRDIHLVSFSVSWELDFINIIKTLEDLNIPLLSKDRDMSHPLVYGGGPVLTANPEPWADFFDFITIGDCENNIDGIVSQTEKFFGFSDSSRGDKLSCFEEIPGIYVPSLYEAILVSVNKAGAQGGRVAKRTSSRLRRTNDRSVLRVHEDHEDDENAEIGVSLHAQGVVKYSPQNYKAIEREKSKPEQLAHSSVIAPDAYWEDTALLEVVRSCPEMCRFCLASYLTLPFRKPDINSVLIPNVEYLLKFTNKIGLLGPSVTQHPEFIELLKYLVAHPKKPQAQVASMRAGTVTLEMAELLVELGVKSMTIAIESGSERLREIMNKKLSEAEIFTACENALNGGIKAVKLYGMVGMPYETDADIEATIDLLKRLKKSFSRLKITWGCSIFTPKAQTPFQNFGIDTSSEKKLQKITKALRPAGIEVRPESYKWTQIQALISRGDRSLSKMFLELTELGDEPSYGDYKKAISKEAFEYFVFKDWGEKQDAEISVPLRYPWQYLMSEGQVAMLGKHALEAEGKAG
ncbi:MAG: radical SAM protein [Cyanobacteria bacterium REEB446]|nr:radical SAM protein [Cyanobacteria bacterium REEB446]